MLNVEFVTGDFEAEYRADTPSALSKQQVCGGASGFCGRV